MKKPSKTTLAAIGVGLFLTWGGNYGISSVIADSNYQEIREMYYESRDWTNANEYYERRDRLEKNVDFWERNAKFPLANQLGLFQEEEPKVVKQPQRKKKKPVEEVIKTEYERDYYKITFKDVEFLHYEIGFIDKFDSLTLNGEQRTLIDSYPRKDGKVSVDQILEWDTATNNLIMYSRYKNGEIVKEYEEMFLKADNTMAKWKEKLDTKSVEKEWKRIRKHM